MNRKFFSAGEAVPIIKPAWEDPERTVVIMYVLREEDVDIVNGALSLVYVDLDEAKE